MGDYNAFHDRLKEWYGAHGRKDLPWRTTDDPYHIYISEVMLQQTQVKTVLERFYFQFLERFQTLKALADAPEHDVLKAWEGLGYYSRARNLHKAAKLAAPKLPSTVEELMALPGIGRNTAHAISALAFHQPTAVMEANLKRVLCRIFALETPTDKELWDYADRLLDRDDPFTYNQAMMDVGATICSPKSPACSLCPANSICRGKETPEIYPQKKVKKQIPTRRKIMLIVADANGRIYCTPRTTRFLGGLYHFCELDAETQTHSALGETVHINKAELIGEVRHTYSHFKLEAEVRYTQLATAANSDDWHAPDAIASLPLSRADSKAWQLMPLHNQPDAAE